MLRESRLQVGVDVPWVTAWTGEAILGVRPCTVVENRMALHQADRLGHGRPIYSQNHLNRQRRSVRYLLCPMCGGPTQSGDRWTQTATPTAAGLLRARGMGHLLPAATPDTQRVLNAGGIAPSHRACAERALQHCPHLRAMPDKTLRPFPDRWYVAPLLIAASLPHGAAGPAPVITFLQLTGFEAARTPTRSVRGRPAPPRLRVGRG